MTKLMKKLSLRKRKPVFEIGELVRVDKDMVVETIEEYEDKSPYAYMRGSPISQKENVLGIVREYTDRRCRYLIIEFQDGAAMRTCVHIFKKAK